VKTVPYCNTLELEQLLLAVGKDYGGAGPPSRTAKFEALSA